MITPRKHQKSRNIIGTVPKSIVLQFGILFLIYPSFAVELSSENTALGRLTLETAITEGLKDSPTVQRAEAALKTSQWKKVETMGTSFMPQLSASALHYFAAQYPLSTVAFGGLNATLPGMYPADQFSLDLSIPVFNGFANMRQWEAESLNQDAAEQELIYAQFSVAEEIRVAFYQALAATLLEEVANENVKSLEDHLKQVNIQKQGGVATNYDTLRVEVQLNEAKADAIDAQDNSLLTRKKLTSLLGHEQDERPLEGTLPVPDPNKIKLLEVNQAPPERADIQALDLRAEAANKIQSARGAWLVPSISLAGQYVLYNSQIYNNTVTNTGNFLSAYNVGAFLKWNLFDGGASYARSHQAEFQAIQAEKTRELAKVQFPYNFAYWKRRYLSNADHYVSKQLDTTRSEESVRLAKAEERAGARTSTEVLDAELDLFRARAGVVNAQVNAAEAQIRLEIALGRRI
jgi:outer membrane protein TolC